MLSPCLGSCKKPGRGETQAPARKNPRQLIRIVIIPLSHSRQDRSLILFKGESGSHIAKLRPLLGTVVGRRREPSIGGGRRGTGGESQAIETKEIALQLNSNLFLLRVTAFANLLPSPRPEFSRRGVTDFIKASDRAVRGVALTLHAHYKFGSVATRKHRAFMLK